MRKYLVLIVLVILVAVSGIFGIRSMLADLSSAVLNRIAPAFLSGKSIAEFKETLDKHDEMLDEIFDLRAKLIEAERISSQNELLRAQVGVSANEKRELELVEIFNVSFEEVTSTAFINKGEKDGIRIGMPLITGKSVLAGIISEVHEDYSKIMLITDKRFKLTVLDEEQNQFLALGDGGEGVKLDYVTARDSFRERELIVTEVSKDIPGFLVIGEVDSTTHEEIDLFKKVRVKPTFLNFDLKSGFIIKDF